MNEQFNTTPDMQDSGEGVIRANPSYYLDRISATILMVIKLAEGLSVLCIAILTGVVLQTVLDALNRVFQQGTTVDDGKAMVAQVLKTLQVPAETIKQVIDAFPLNITFSSKPVVYVFAISLPFVLIAVLEAIAAIRLRLGKGGTRTIGILERIYYVLGGVRILVIALSAIVLSIVTIFRLGGVASIVLSTIYVSLAIFFILVYLPALLYHRYLARVMDDIGYEMQTGKRSTRRPAFFQKILIVLIVLEVIGAAVWVIASWSPQQGGVAAGLLIGAMIGPAAKLLKYICVMCCYRNFMQADSGVQEERRISHTPQIILVVLVTLFFALPIIFLCVQSSVYSNAIVDKVEEFFSNARQTVNEVSVEAQAQIEAAQAAIDAQAQEVQAALDAGAQAAGAADESGAQAAAPAQDNANEQVATPAQNNANTQAAAPEQDKASDAPQATPQEKEAGGGAAPAKDAQQA